MERDFNTGFVPPYMDYNMPPPNMDANEIMMQYEQACSYYRYLCLQMDYKIKCKEYERLCGRDRKIEQYLVWLKNFSPMI